MCIVYFKELKGWFKSFTRTEILLCLLEAVLSLLLLGFIVFLILHFLACSQKVVKIEHVLTNDTKDTTVIMITTNATVPVSSSRIDEVTTVAINTGANPLLFSTIAKPTKPRTPATVKPGIKCTWKVSQKTEAYTHYFYPVTKSRMTETTAEDLELYDNAAMPQTATEVQLDATIETNFQIIVTPVPSKDVMGDAASTMSSNMDRYLSDISDGEDATKSNKQYVLALVKLKPPKDITFGCILTVVSDFWVLTAASCLEAIEEVDSLDNFIIMECYGTRFSKTHAVADVQIHPLYQGANRSYDLAALKSEGSLVKGRLKIVELPKLLDYFLVTIGERFTVLGYGAFRTINKGPSVHSLRQAYVHSLPAKQCPISPDTWELRTLKPGEPIVHAPCGTAPLCAGVLFTRGTPCNYCAGTPLMYGSVLYGIMSDNQQCGVSCEPQIYVNIATVRDWLDSVIDNK